MTDSESIINALTAAIKSDDNGMIESITKRSRQWCKGTNTAGYTILQEAMRLNKPIIFNNLLEQHDLVNLEAINAFDENALSFAVNIVDVTDYYAFALIEKGAFIHGVSQNDNLTLLHQVILKSSVSLTKLLLDKGIDVNAQDSNGYTALHKALLKEKRGYIYELVTMLLCYGADPFNAGAGTNAFEISVKHRCETRVQEVLCWYTFDHQMSQLSSEVLLQMMKEKSPLLPYLRECSVKFISEDEGYVEMFRFLLRLHIDDLKELLDPFDTMICNVLDDLNGPCGNTYWIVQWNYMYDLLGSDNVLQQLQLLVENDSLRSYIAYFFSVIDSDLVTTYVIKRHKADDMVDQILTSYILYGLTVDRRVVNRVYRELGYGDLFKLLLHLDHEDEPTMFPNSVMVAAICEVSFSLETLFACPNKYDIYGFEFLLDYFANPQLCLYFKLHRNVWNISRECLKRAESHPQVPLLQEMARNVLRRYLAWRFNATNTKEFYAVVNGLLIAPGYKKIITFEKKLY